MTEFSKIETGRRIQELRVYNKLSQTQLARIIGIAPNTLSQYESGKSGVSIEVLMLLAQALETTTDYLLGLTEY